MVKIDLESRHLLITTARGLDTHSDGVMIFLCLFAIRKACDSVLGGGGSPTRTHFRLSHSYKPQSARELDDSLKSLDQTSLNL